MIFILEDRPKPMMTIVAAMRRRGLSVTPCGSRLKAQRILNARWRPGDIILLDRDDDNGLSFHDCVPPGAWPNVVSISGEARWNDIAMQGGASAAVPKQGNLFGWSMQVVAAVEKISLGPTSSG